MIMLPVASGKGGVGKSLISANLSLALAGAGTRVVLADLDLGGSNLHTILGMRGLPAGIGTFLSGRSSKFSSVIVPTEYERLRFIPGDTEIPDVANLTAAQRRRLIKNLKGVDADCLVVDLGSGSSHHTVDLFLASPVGIIVTTPNVTAILNAYLFLKSAVFRLLTTSFDASSKATAKLKELRRTPSAMQRLYVPNLVEELAKSDAKGVARFRDRLDRFHPAIILNLLDDPRDAAKAGKIKRSCKQYLGIELEHLGVVYRDTLQQTALASGLPILVYKPDSVLSRAIHRIADKILESGWIAPEGEAGEEAAGFGLIDESYDTAQTEAEVDFAYKFESMQDLLDSGTLSQGDLIETIRNQQYELGRLRRENSYLKAKLVEAAQAGYDVAVR